MAGDKVEKNCRRSENKIDCALTAGFIVCDGTGFEEKIKSILLHNN